MELGGSRILGIFLEVGVVVMVVGSMVEVTDLMCLWWWRRQVMHRESMKRAK